MGWWPRFSPRRFISIPLVNTHSIPRRFDMVYYSFGTMTSVGASGITPVSDAARSLTAIEATIGRALPGGVDCPADQRLSSSVSARLTLASAGRLVN